MRAGSAKNEITVGRFLSVAGKKSRAVSGTIVSQSLEFILLGNIKIPFPKILNIFNLLLFRFFNKRTNKGSQKGGVLLKAFLFTATEIGFK